MKLGVLTVCAALVLAAGPASAMGQPPSHFNDFNASSNPFRPVPNTTSAAAFVDEADARWHTNHHATPHWARPGAPHHMPHQTRTGGPSGGIW